jgi:hypothetical protein
VFLGWPADTKQLTTAEKEMVKNKMKDDGERSRQDTMNRSTAGRIVQDRKVYLGWGAFSIRGCLILTFGFNPLQYCRISISSAALSVFMPTIIRELGYSSLIAQVYTILVWTVSAVATVGVGWLSYHVRRHAIFSCAGYFVAMLGYILLLCQQHLSAGVRYFTVFILAAGAFTMQPISVVWILTNLSGNHKRSVGSAMVLGLGSVGSIIAGNIFLSSEAPKFQTGYGVSFAFVGLEVCLGTVFLLGLKRENKKRDCGASNVRLNLPQEELDSLGESTEMIILISGSTTSIWSTNKNCELESFEVKCEHSVGLSRCWHLPLKCLNYMMLDLNGVFT